MGRAIIDEILHECTLSHNQRTKKIVKPLAVYGKGQCCGNSSRSKRAWLSRICTDNKEMLQPFTAAIAKWDTEGLKR